MDKNLKKPKISVVMAVYNSELYVGESIESILNQKFKDFEFIIINDGSTDRSLEIVKSYKDKRIKLIDNKKNMGHTDCLNQGINISRGEYIARMDSDDVSLPNRLATQVSFMDSHPEIAVCGTWVKTIGEGKSFTNRLLTDPDDIKTNLLFYTSLAHPTVMIRKSFLIKHNLRYSIATDRDENSEDYGLWSEMANFGYLANIPKVLLHYRIRPESVSSVHSKKQKTGASLVRRKLLIKLGLLPSEKDIETHNSTKPSHGENIISFLDKEEIWLMKIIGANNQSKIYKEKSLDKIIYERWRVLCGLNTKNGLMVWRKFRSSPLFKLGGKKRNFDSMKILIKCVPKIN